MAINGARMRVFVDDYIGWAMIRTGAFEEESLNLASKLMSQGGVFVDVGANAGLFTNFLAVNKRVSCISIEPHPRNFLRLQKNILLDLNRNVHLYNVCLSSGFEFLELEDIDPLNSGKIRVHSEDELSAGSRFILHAVSLEKVLAHARCEQVKLMKVDVEGFEFSVLNGFDWTGRAKPENVIVEFTDYTKRFGGNGKEDLIAYFSVLGYEAFTVNGEPLISAMTPLENNAWFKLG